MHIQLVKYSIVNIPVLKYCYNKTDLGLRMNKISDTSFPRSLANISIRFFMSGLLITEEFCWAFESPSRTPGLTILRGVLLTTGTSTSYNRATSSEFTLQLQQGQVIRIYPLLPDILTQITIQGTTTAFIKIPSRLSNLFYFNQSTVDKRLHTSSQTYTFIFLNVHVFKYFNIYVKQLSS